MKMETNTENKQAVKLLQLQRFFYCGGKKKKKKHERSNLLDKETACANASHLGNADASEFTPSGSMHTVD